MLDQTRQSLQLIVDKAAKLKSLAFEEHVRKVGFSFSGTMRPEGDWEFAFSHPEEKERDAFLLTFRFFYQRNERSAVPNLETLEQDPSLSDHWRREALAVRELWDNYLSGTSAYSVNLFEGRPTRREMLDAVLYGDLVHANRPQRLVELQRLTPDDIRASVLQQEITKFLLTLLALVYRIAEASAEELN